MERAADADEPGRNADAEDGFRSLSVGARVSKWGSDQDPRFLLTLQHHAWAHATHKNPAAAGALGGGPTFDVVGQNRTTIVAQNIGSLCLQATLQHKVAAITLRSPPRNTRVTHALTNVAPSRPIRYHPPRANTGRRYLVPGAREYMRVFQPADQAINERT